MKVRFPIYFEVVGEGEMDLPDDIDTSDENAVREYIDDHWDDVPLPEETEFVSDSCQFDWDAPIQIEG